MDTLNYNDTLLNKLQDCADDYYTNEKRSVILEAKDRIQHLEDTIDRAIKVAFSVDMARDKCQSMYNILSRAIRT